MRRIPSIWVVLPPVLEPQADAQRRPPSLQHELWHGGFFPGAPPKLARQYVHRTAFSSAGCCQGPRRHPRTPSPRPCAAGRRGVLVLIDKGHVEQEPNTRTSFRIARLQVMPPALVRNTAITFDEATKKAVINEALCKGCGTCVSSCPSGSIAQNLFEDDGSVQRNRRRAG